MTLFALAPSRGPRWPLAIQAALGISVPIAVMTIAGAPALGYIAASGAFTVLFLGSAPVIDRVRVLPLVAAGLVLSATLGVIAAGNAWWVGIGVVIVAVGSAALAFGFRLGPPGPLFFVLIFGLSGHVVAASSVDPLVYIAALAAGCGFSLLVAMTPLLLPRARAVHPRPLKEILPGPSLDADSRVLLLRVAVVAVSGVLLGLVIDPTRTYWIVGSAVAVIGVAAARRAAFERGLHRMLGTVVGVGVYALLALLHPSGIWLAVLLGALQFTIELVVVRHYALALVFITPLVLLLTGAATGSIGSMDVAWERIVDTLVGAMLGAASGLLHPRRGAKPA
ncbi:MULTISPECIES: FUSC family protein [unclassified Microbacterium]|uniref:FUSC family protein n=1 Tax=unclassified Microbacterium TaxID=2609290 RepID=UPI000EAA4ED5|nr:MULTISPECIES: FUSC family protein [unclassified Microbacterium]MBT2484748.1 FUSC family protein [Microbacterium sp. ISL-108]RKN67627.1 FUSC family protein [Microbacterium sp. CGR2]